MKRNDRAECGRATLSRLAAASSAWMLSVQMLVAQPLDRRGVSDEPCPPGAIAIAPGASIQAVVDNAGNGAAFCLKNGVHRMQTIRPRPGQSFYGEGHTVLNGTRLLTTFTREGRYWVAEWRELRGQRHGQCAKEAPACDLPEALFIDDKPLGRVLSKDGVEPGRFYLDYTGRRLYFADDPTGRSVEVTSAFLAFESTAPNVRIRNLTVEKYGNRAQRAAIEAGRAEGWTIENSEVRLNSGNGIGLGTGSRVRGCDSHHNGQLGMGGVGRDILVENNWIWANNIHGFDFGWEAGGVKIVLSDGVIFRGNHVQDNVGPGLWCDINCRNVLYEGNFVERNHGAGIFHEISFNAVIRNNVVRNNGIGETTWFWGDDILIAASQDVDVYGNTLNSRAGGCAIILIDQNRRTKGGAWYKTRNNTIHDNEMTFEGAACAGGASDARPGDENFSIITDGNNSFDRNLYSVRGTSGPPRLVWGHAVFDWNGLRETGLEPNGRWVVY